MRPRSFTLLPVGGPLALDAVFEYPGVLMYVVQRQPLIRIQHEQLQDKDQSCTKKVMVMGQGQGQGRGRGKGRGEEKGALLNLPS